MQKFHLDFDDAYQYVAAERNIIAELICACEVGLPDGAFRLAAPEAEEVRPGPTVRQEVAEPYSFALVQNVLYV